MIDFFKVTPKKRTVLLRQRKGVIFSNPSLGMRVLFGLGNTIILGSVVGLIYLYLPLGKVVFNYYASEEISNGDVPKVEPTKPVEPVQLSNFDISIPKIGAATQVESNVSPFDIARYEEILKDNRIVHSSSSSLPGSGRGHSIFIFAHSSESGILAVRSNPTFYLLGEMKNGDEILVNKDGRTFKYRVYDKKVVKADEIDYLYYGDPQREVLILQTCWPLGTNWKRLLIFGELVS